MNNVTAIREDYSIKVDPRVRKYLTFFPTGEEYGVEILKVQEIIRRMPITPVSLTSRYVRGVINLRKQRGRIQIQLAKTKVNNRGNN